MFGDIQDSSVQTMKVYKFMMSLMLSLMFATYATAFL